MLAAAIVLGAFLAAALGAFLAAALGATAALIANDPSAPPAAADALAASWIGALTGCAYAAMFALGSTLGLRGGGRIVALVLDFALGSTSGVVGLRFHARTRRTC